MRTSLGLAGDLDDVDLVQDVESAFGIRLPDERLTQCKTVGDLFELVVDYLPTQVRDADRCASTMCFYRVRRAVRTIIPDISLRPSTPIDVFRSVQIRTLYQAIERDAALKSPAPYLSAWGGASLLGAALVPLSLFFLGATWEAIVVSFAVTLVCYRLSPIRLPPTVKTLGGLVELITARNIGSLASQGARLRSSEAWKALRTICQEHAVANEGEIGANTLIMRL